MNLWNDSFLAIKNKTKTIEMRLRYEKRSAISIGYSESEVANPGDMLAYYSAENIEKYGVLGIELIVK